MFKSPEEHFYLLVQTPHHQGCDIDFTSESNLYETASMYTVNLDLKILKTVLFPGR